MNQENKVIPCELCGWNDAVMSDPTWDKRCTEKPQQICEGCAKYNIERAMYRQVN